MNTLEEFEIMNVEEIDLVEDRERIKTRRIQKRKSMKKDKYNRTHIRYTHVSPYITRYNAKKTLRKALHKQNRINIDVIKYLNDEYDDTSFNSKRANYYGNTHKGVHFGTFLWMMT